MGGGPWKGLILCLPSCFSSGFWALNSCRAEAHIFPLHFTAASIWDCGWNIACLSLPLAGLTQFKRGLRWAESFLLEAGEGRGWELGSEHRQGAP